MALRRELFFYCCRACLVILSITARTFASCPTFISSVEEEVVCPGEELTYSCTIYDFTNTNPTAVWSGFCADGSVINIAHGQPAQESGMCGPFSVQATGSNGTCYTSTLTVNASAELNGTVIQCSHESDQVGNARLIVGTGLLKLQVDPIYKNSTLVQLSSSWEAVCSSKVKYTIHYICDSDMTHISVAECTAGSIFHDIDTELILADATHCEVSAFAAGLREEKNVSVSNKFFKVDVDPSRDQVEVACSFTEGYSGMAGCRIEFSYTDGSAMASSHDCISANDAPILLRVSLPPNTNYSYVAFAVGDGCSEFQQPISVSGSGVTGDYGNVTCETGNFFRGNCSFCGNETITGCANYTSLKPGFVATFSCCDGYNLLGNNTLICNSNGHWNETIPTCVKEAAQSASAYATEIGLGVATAVLAPACLILLVIVICNKKKEGSYRPPDTEPNTRSQETEM